MTGTIESSPPRIVLEPTSQPTSDADRTALLEDPGFGRVFSDHMVSARWEKDQGWLDVVVRPRAPLSLDPAAMVLHYGQAVFEGFKAYAQADGAIRTFRAADHGRRFNASLARLAMPPLPVETFVQAAHSLLRIDRAWVPRVFERSYYLRPFMIATEASLGVRPASSYLFMIIGSPSAAYFAGGVRSVSVWLTEEYVRASPGGTGMAKCSGNYAASLLAQAQAKEQGCDQVLWTDAAEHRYIEEMGGMNVCFVFRDDHGSVLVTPSLETGTLLAGMTRASLLQLAADRGIRTEERRLTVDEVKDGIETGRLEEAFACGTAAVITPIGEFKSAQGSWKVRGDGYGPVAKGLRDALLSIQYGRADDRYGWMRSIDA